MNDHLVGHTIKEMKIADDNKAILFVTNEEEVIAKTYGSCCSSTWIEHVETVKLPAKVIAVEDIEMPDMGQPSDEDEVIQYYGCRITTNKGYIVIDYRNSSNGYYGGYLSWPDDSYFDGGVDGQNISSENWVEINE